MENKRMGCYVETITDIDGYLDVKMDEIVGHGAKRNFNYNRYFELNKNVTSYRRKKRKDYFN